MRVFLTCSGPRCAGRVVGGGVRGRGPAGASAGDGGRAPRQPAAPTPLITTTRKE